MQVEKERKRLEEARKELDEERLKLTQHQLKINIKKEYEWELKYREELR